MLHQTEKSSLKNILKHTVTSCTKIILTLFSIHFSPWFLSHMLQMLFICLFVYTTNISDSLVQYCSLPMFLEQGWVTGGKWVIFHRYVNIVTWAFFLLQYQFIYNVFIFYFVTSVFNPYQIKLQNCSLWNSLMTLLNKSK